MGVTGQVEQRDYASRLSLGPLHCGETVLNKRGSMSRPSAATSFKMSVCLETRHSALDAPRQLSSYTRCGESRHSPDAREHTPTMSRSPSSASPPWLACARASYTLQDGLVASRGPRRCSKQRIPASQRCKRHAWAAIWTWMRRTPQGWTRVTALKRTDGMAQKVYGHLGYDVQCKNGITNKGRPAHGRSSRSCVQVCVSCCIA